MFIWEWVLIALGWLVFLMVVAFCLAITISLIEEFSNRKQVIQHLDLQEQTAIIYRCLTVSNSMRFLYLRKEQKKWNLGKNDLKKNTTN